MFNEQQQWQFLVQDLQNNSLVFPFDQSSSAIYRLKTRMHQVHCWAFEESHEKSVLQILHNKAKKDYRAKKSLREGFLCLATSCPNLGKQQYNKQRASTSDQWNCHNVLVRSHGKNIKLDIEKLDMDTTTSKTITQNREKGRLLIHSECPDWKMQVWTNRTIWWWSGVLEVNLVPCFDITGPL